MRMRLEEFDYFLPAEKIAQEPAAERDAARLMVVDRSRGELRHCIFRDLPELLRPGDLLVLNDTRVIPARLRGVRPTGGKIQALLVGRGTRNRWKCWVDSSRPVRPGERLRFGEGVEAEVLEKDTEQGGWWLEFDRDLEPVLDRVGEPPLPPYIRRPEGARPEDRERYQTVFAREPGSIAAPTAALHFTMSLLSRLLERGIEIATLTLHVGVGTFRPIRSERIGDHVMDAERYAVPEETLAALRRAREEGRRVVAVGTTVVRVLESLARGAPREGETRLFIHPPFEFLQVGAMVTNFHLPRSTPLVLVCALAGKDRILRAYEEAASGQYRFYSYGDAMLIL